MNHHLGCVLGARYHHLRKHPWPMFFKWVDSTTRTRSRPVVRSPAPLSTQPQPFCWRRTKSAQCFDPCEINVFFSFFRGGIWCGRPLSFLLFMSFFFSDIDQLLVDRESAESFWRMFNFEKELGQCSISGSVILFFSQITIYIYVYIYMPGTPNNHL